ncbi:substrate-binding domain-containing protein [Anaerocellum diazotrophicum]|uniref:ABC transporter substrate-binding protein n=1 Tax=Caldicellulosiruptor diazotrophicus TaxID=2806205 RepID=A0ABM7NNG5_9FIRM|nr:substrate-binding domain-containing protein [Caldicellulosiruptor diazotrophicus]BCS81688.1 ABC transporter substrate-binding protein [Caldicellulosiruptor diazotrophicus]
MKKEKYFRNLAALLFLIWIATFNFISFSYSKTYKIATTTSIYDSGFLNFVTPIFEKENNIKFDFISVGSGQAVKIFRNGDVDGIIIHEKSFLDELKKEKLINGYTAFVLNYFILVGPKDKKDLFKKVKSVQEAFALIRKNNFKFVSRADNSATYIRELEIWKLANVQQNFGGYIKSGQGMGMSLNLANEKGAFILTDEATFYRMKDTLDNLDVVYQNPKDQVLTNIYYFAYSPKKAQLYKFATYLKSKEFKDLVTSFNIKFFKKEIYRVVK